MSDLKASIYYLDWKRPETFGRASEEFRRFYALMGGHVHPTVKELHGPEYIRIGEAEIDDHIMQEDLATDDNIPRMTLEDLYKRLQNDMGTSVWCNGRRVRSMSIGDVVSIKGYLYVVASCGFERVEPETPRRLGDQLGMALIAALDKGRKVTVIPSGGEVVIRLPVDTPYGDEELVVRNFRVTVEEVYDAM